jgi:hypothetical protein
MKQNDTYLSALILIPRTGDGPRWFCNAEQPGGYGPSSEKHQRMPRRIGLSSTKIDRVSRGRLLSLDRARQHVGPSVPADQEPCMARES